MIDTTALPGMALGEPAVGHPPGLAVHFLRRADGRDASTHNNCLSARHTGGVIVAILRDMASGRRIEPLPERFPARVTPDRPALWLAYRIHFGGARDWYIVPASPGDFTDDDPRLHAALGWRHGGNYAATATDRLARIIGGLHAVRVHDVQGW